jgi:hypothetical protein
MPLSGLCTTPCRMRSPIRVFISVWFLSIQLLAQDRGLKLGCAAKNRLGVYICLFRQLPHIFVKTTATYLCSDNCHISLFRQLPHTYIFVCSDNCHTRIYLFVQTTATHVYVCLFRQLPHTYIFVCSDNCHTRIFIHKLLKTF